MSRTALSKNTTYGTQVTNARNEARMTTTGFSLLTDANLYLVISLIVQRMAKVLVDANKPFYRDKENLSLIGDASPYWIDCSALNPYVERPVRLTHVTSGGTRTPITVLNPNNAEDLAKLTTIAANSIYALQVGWGFRVFFGSSVTVTKSTDVIEFSFDGQPIVASAVSGTYLDVPDTLVPFAKDELVEYMLKYRDNLPYQVVNEARQQRLKTLLEAA